MIVIRKKHAFVAREKGSPVIGVIAPTRMKAIRTLDSLRSGIMLTRNQRASIEFRFYRACGLPVKESYFRALEAVGEEYANCTQ